MSIPTRIGIDIGGTFTDAFAVTPSGIRIAKVPSTPQEPWRAVITAVEALQLEETPEDFLHGTTLVTNMILEHKGAPTGFITTQGMRDVLHIGRHERPLTYAIRQVIPQQHYPPVPRKWRRTVAERIGADGQVVVPLNESEVRQVVRWLVEQGVQAIAIGFLHAYRYPEHERLAEQWARSEAPQLFICTSHEVSPRFREYERFMTTVWNARVAPGAARYLSELSEQLQQRWEGLRLTLMTSNGGLEEVNLAVEETFGELRRTPIRLALSGPAAAGNACVRVVQDLGLRHCVGLDVGGTSSDIIVVRDGRLNEAPWEERRIGGYPLQIPMLDLHTIGAGGGSLVKRDEFGALHVGPQSAGADPGPACYGRGGELPTVTDAAVIAGRIPPDLLLGGSLPIYPELAWKAFERTFGAGRETVINSALDVLGLAEANIAFGIRERTVKRGLDPAELSLVAAGGAGPLVACGVAEVLELAEVIVPPRPGLLAAWGLLSAPQRREAASTVLRLLRSLDESEAEALFRQTAQKLSTQPPPGAKLLRTAAMRYLGQGFEVEVAVDEPVDLAALEERFHLAHEHEYGFSMRNSAVEWVELRVAWEQPSPSWAFDTEGPTELPPERRLTVYERGAGGENYQTHQAHLFERRLLPFGFQITGPAVITERDATIYVPSGWSAQVVENGYIRIRRK
ncbi:MAG: hydantoinase/oxoprolinase family protein [Anaerolineales bacterium]|nr:hydantoinase/oxoprolinase family protein [Anaerolineales bacterium]MDW8445704.1 hydantoinase/oxoprolinase family protein [Anaerolineales bacterium]